MENNRGLTGRLQEQPINKTGYSIHDNLEENFQEFKHSVLLHEKGVEMQEGNGNKNLKSKHKISFHLNSIQNVEHLTQKFEEEKELRVRFEEKHR